MPEVIFPLDSSKKFENQEKVGHNRWHPEIPPVATVKPGDSFRVHCREWFDGAIVNDDSADDILNAPLKTVHKLSGPEQLVRQIQLSRELGGDGFVLFQLNERLATRFLPRLQLGTTAAPPGSSNQ